MWDGEYEICRERESADLHCVTLLDAGGKFTMKDKSHLTLKLAFALLLFFFVNIT